jgi:hypothetical protein
MDMAIQPRENDLVLGTHGRSVIVLDDYSPLRGLNEKSFAQDLKLLSVGDGQQYVSHRAPSSRFWGDAAYVGDNEVYGVTLNVMAAGDHLVHPDKDKEKQRKLAKAKAVAEKAKAKKDSDKDAKSDSKEKKLSDKARVTVKDAEGKVVRTFVTKLKQGVNRIVWGLESDGGGVMPGQEPKENKDIKPSGPEVIPGTYTLHVKLNDHEFETTAKVLKDPRFKDVSQQDMKARYDLEHNAVSIYTTLTKAVHALNDSKKDIEVIKGMANKTLAGVKENKDEHPASKLAKSAEKLVKQIGELDKNLRSIPKVKGIVDETYKVTLHVFMAWGYVGGRYGKPSPTAEIYLEKAKIELDKGVGKVNEFIEKDLAEFKKQYQDSGLGLLSSAKPIALN